MTAASWVAQLPLLRVFRENSRYVFGVVGPLSVAVAHFASALVFLRRLVPEEFGVFAFVMAMVQFSFGASNALLAAPFSVNFSCTNAPRQGQGVYFRVNSYIALVAGFACSIAGWLMGGWRTAVFAGLFAALAVLRWFFRSYHYALHQPGRVALCDLSYSLTLIGVLVWIGRSVESLEQGFAAMSIAAFLGVLAAGPSCMVAQLRSWARGSANRYRSIWRDQSRWAMLGVVSTEAVSNAHVWLVSIFFGPGAFAPLAASALLFRPVALIIGSLTQLERPAMARALARNDPRAAARISQRFRVIAMLVWVGSTTLAALILIGSPDLILKGKYDVSVVGLATVLNSLIFAVQAWRASDGSLAQAGNEFKLLANASLISGAVAIAGVAVSLYFFPPAQSLVGVLVSQIVLALLVSRQVKKLYERV